MKKIKRMQKEGMNMQRFFMPVVAVGLCLMVIAVSVVADSGSAIQVEKLATAKLPVPPITVEKNYLGLSTEGFFTLPQINSEVVIIQIFSMYCPKCQAAAPKVNELFRLMERKEHVRGKVKLIGIGAGNSAYEVEVFKKTYQIPFPLFPDADYSLHKICGEVRTPYFIGAKIDPDKSFSVFHTKLGEFDDANQFLDQILTLSGLKEG